MLAVHIGSEAGVAVLDVDRGVAGVRANEACAFFLSALRVTDRVSS